jgi:integrase
MGIFQKGDQWYIDYYVKGRRKRKKIGPSRKLAGDVLKDVQVKIAKGEYLGVYEEKKILFEEYAKEYLKYSKANKAPSTYRRDEVSLNPNLIPVFKGVYLYEITPEMVEQYKAARLSDVEPATVNREIACLRNLFNKAVAWRYVRRNPVHGVKMLKEPPGRIRYLESAEITALLKAIDTLPRKSGAYLKPIVVMALNTGMRKAEILNLKWSAVDLNARKITILKSKNNEVRTVPVNDTLFEALNKLYKASETRYVFAHSDGDAFRNVRRSFDRALKLAKIQDFVFHDLRHTFASHLVMSGCNLRTVQQLMGHKDIKMTMRYSHLSKEHLQDAVSKLDLVWTPYGHQANIERTETHTTH